MRGLLALAPAVRDVGARARSVEWLIDNDYLVQSSYEEVRDSLTRGFYGRLPVLTTGSHQGKPRVEGVAEGFIDAMGGDIDVDRLAEFVTHYQRSTGLSIAELWALPIMLRLALLERIATVAPSIFGDAGEAGWEQSGRADDRALVDSVVGLRVLATQDWQSFFESVSKVDRLLRRDPGATYDRMDFETRDSYRRAIERLARATDWCTEEWIAERALELAGRAARSDLRRRHVGYYLVDEGLRRLEEAAGYRPPLRVGAGRAIQRYGTLAYLGTIAALTVGVVAALCAYAFHDGGGALELALVVAVSAIPASSLAVSVVNFAASQLIKPLVLPKLDFTDGVLPEFRSIVVIPSLLSDPEEIDSLLADLEIRYLGNNDPSIVFALLGDLVDAPQEHTPEDRVLLDRARRGVDELNRRHGDGGRRPFLMLRRERLWNPIAGCWMGWERKRGKLVEFNRLLSGSMTTSYTAGADEIVALRGITFVITLDADTKLPRGAAARLIGTMAHPLNRPALDPDSGDVMRGYTILQPRIAMDPVSSNRTLFSRTLAADLGFDLYSHAVSDVYQDLFGEGNYAGKGIYDPVAFEHSLHGRVPENALLSHDLFEGIHGRAGLVSDVLVLEDYPADVRTYLRRIHRWVRGDWQLLPWLLPWVPNEKAEWTRSTLSLLDRWKMFDNLRRSLVSASLLLFLASGWIWLPEPAWVWTAIALGIVGASVLLAGLAGVQRVALGPDKLPALAGTGWSVRLELMRRLLSFTMMPMRAATNCDAIVRTVFRVVISRKRLLEWVPAAHAAAASSTWRRAVAWRQMLPGLAITVTIGGLVVWLAPPSAAGVAAPFLVLWLAAPQVAYWTGLPVHRREQSLGEADLESLRRVARLTWRFFERFVGPESHWLPPDHYQEDPGPELAQRTSPTDVGMLLLATVSASDLGYLGALELASRLHNTFDGMEKLERYWGHFLNWYDIEEVRALEPRYVSTVDSGNLAAALLVAARCCDELLEGPVDFSEQRDGLVDTLDLLTWSLGRLEPAALRKERDALLAALDALRLRVAETHDDTEWAIVVGDLRDRVFPACEERLAALVEEAAAGVDVEKIAELHTFSELVRQGLERASREVEALVPWYRIMGEVPGLLRVLQNDDPVGSTWRQLARALTEAPVLARIPDICATAARNLARFDAALDAHRPDGASDEMLRDARRWSQRLLGALEQAGKHAASIASELERAADRADALFDAMDFSFLFDRRRQIFHIGFNLAAAAVDRNYYDLLASEARLASLVAIAKGDAPPSHWIHLGRPFTGVNGNRALVSWGGTAFEYLLPTLLTRTPAESLLGQSCAVAVDEQLTFARRHQIPWGISESGYYNFDQHRHYQYRAFGIPSLGLAVGLGERLVVAPYASLMALDVRPQDVVGNLAVLEGLGMLGRYGLYEALDFGPRDGSTPRDAKIVHSYMVHHQGMILTAIANRVAGDAMIRRFHDDPRIASVEPLVHEEVPHGVPLSTSWRRRRPAGRPQRPVPYPSWNVPLEHPGAQVNLLSNGRLGVLISASGAGTSWRGDIALTRWTPDPTSERDGTWIYVRDEDTGELWSVGSEPVPSVRAALQVRFSPDKAEFMRRQAEISLKMEVAVSPDDDVELRRIVMHNESARPRTLSLTSYAEVVLARREEDRRHPAFSKMFVESRLDERSGALLFRRRPRAAGEAALHMGHAVAGGNVMTKLRWESDRQQFLGRLGSRRSPEALAAPLMASRAGDARTLDPIMSMACQVALMPHEEATITFVTAVADTEPEVLALLDEYSLPARIAQAFRRAREHSEGELDDLELNESELREALGVLSAALYPRAELRRLKAGVDDGPPYQPMLWGSGISGDLPIVLAVVGAEQDARFLRPLLAAHALWRRRGVKIDLVVIDDQGGGYTHALRDRVQGMLNRIEGAAAIGAPGGVFLVGADQLTPGGRAALEASARIVVDSRAGPLDTQLEPLLEPRRRLPTFVPMPSSPLVDEGTTPVARPADLLFDNGIGGFSVDGCEYVIYVKPGHEPPAPWVNVIANPDFGFIVSESGSGYTWAANSAENRLTPWTGDPVLDSPGEVLYLRDEETGEVWSPTPAPAAGPGPYLVRHGAGYTVFEHNSHGLEQNLKLRCHPQEPVKIASLRLANRWTRPRRLTVTYYAEWVLGGMRESSAPFVVPAYDGETGTLLARNTFKPRPDGEPSLAFLAASRAPHGVTGDRTEFLGPGGDPARPEALHRIGLSGAMQAGMDPCAALQVHVDLAPGEETEVHFFLGQVERRGQCADLVRRLRSPREIDRIDDELKKLWDGLLGRLTIRTPNRAMDLLVNRWLLYQAVSCRLWGRSALYQSSGAFGYRDQLQDAMALLFNAPEMARQRIVEAAGRQFEAGDVLHWWHPPRARGVRTRCSDDLLWLPYVAVHYVGATGDGTILDEEVPFLVGPELGRDENDHYAVFQSGSETASLYEHCLRAIERGTTRGPHGLPLIGSGDWNDGLNRVGVGGRGESVWLGWFLYATLEGFAEVCDQRGDADEAARLRQRAAALGDSLEATAWDGEWYARAYFDDGTPLGASSSPECRIDAISQAWAVISKAGRHDRCVRAMRAVDEQLVRDDDRLVLLLTPPFDNVPWDPGYIKGYPPGVRENGGQYTHAAIWVAWAFAELGDGDLAKALFDILNPINRTQRPAGVQRYRVEPYVIAADIGGEPPFVGRGGWTWYTGSAAWLYRLAVEQILGLRLRQGRLDVDPCIPRSWERYEIEVDHRGARYHFEVENPRGVSRGVARIELDGRPFEGTTLPAPVAETHRVLVVLGGAAPDRGGGAPHGAGSWARAGSRRADPSQPQ